MTDVKGGLLYKFFSAGSGFNMHANKFAFNNEKLAEELHKPIIKKKNSLFWI